MLKYSELHVVTNIKRTIYCYEFCSFSISECTNTIFHHNVSNNNYYATFGLAVNRTEVQTEDGNEKLYKYKNR